MSDQQIVVKIAERIVAIYEGGPDDRDGRELTAAEIAPLVSALRLPLLFHQGGEWTPEHRAEWLKITGHEDATTRVMCDHIRKVLGEPCPDGRHDWDGPPPGGECRTCGGKYAELYP